MKDLKYNFQRQWYFLTRKCCIDEDPVQKLSNRVGLGLNMVAGTFSGVKVPTAGQAWKTHRMQNRHSFRVAVKGRACESACSSTDELEV